MTFDVYDLTADYLTTNFLDILLQGIKIKHLQPQKYVDQLFVYF
jgi:hypothetical protein